MTLLNRIALLLALALLTASQTPPAHAQNAGASLTQTETVPQNGIGATMAGARIRLLPDGTWVEDAFAGSKTTIAITDHGHTVDLSEDPIPNSKEKKRTWKPLGSGGGPIQIVVSRAINTAQSAHSTTDNCIPVVTVRNLTKIGVFRIVVELRFTDTRSPDRTTSSISMMVGDLDEGEQEDLVASPLLEPYCGGLEAEMHIPFCRFSNGVTCEHLVTGSRYGTIPIVGVAQALNVGEDYFKKEPN